MKLSDAVNEVLTLARAIQSYWESELPKYHPNYPLVNPGEVDPPSPPEEKVLHDLLRRLPDDIVYQLAIVRKLAWGMNNGRADVFRIYHELKQRFPTSDDVVSECLETPSLVPSLEDGLDELAKHGIDVDHLTLSPVHAGS